VSIHVKYPSFLSDFNETSFLSKILEKYSNFKFNENLSCGSRTVPCVRTDRQTRL